MRVPDVTLSDIVLILLYLGVLWFPGGFVGAAAGLRGWSLVGVAPLLTYGIAGLAAPWYSATGVRWSASTFLLACVVTVTVVVGLRAVVRRPSRRFAGRPPCDWGRWAHLWVGVAVGVAALLGAVSIIGGMGGLRTIPQDWDAVFHANGIRWIAENGDGGLFAMSQVNWYEGGTGIFYPNAYHLLGSVVYELTGRDIPSVLNAHTVLIPGLLALSLVAVVHRLRGRAVLAGAVALTVVGVSAVYDLLWRGPVLPFATGVALIPVAIVLLVDLLDAQGWRAKIVPGLLTALGVAGLACLHPSMVFGAAMFALPMLVQRWWQRPARLRTEPAVIFCTLLVAIGLLAMQLAGALNSAASLPPFDWPAELSPRVAITEVATFGHHPTPGPQWVLAVALGIGVLTYRRLGNLRWIGAAGLIFGALFVIAAAFDTPWAEAITRPWWNDRWRLAALAAVPLVVVAAHGLAEVQRLLARPIQASMRLLLPTWRPAVVATALSAVLVGAALVNATDGLYLGRNQQKMAINTGDGPAISASEIEGYRALAQLVPPGTSVLNDRGDGSVWMYALAGVRPVAGHYDGTLIGPDALLLAQRFNKYGTDPAVQAAAKRQAVGYVVVGSGFLRGDAVRESGLVDLPEAEWLEQVYSNGDVVIYKLLAPPPPAVTKPPRSRGAPAGRSTTTTSDESPS